MSASSRKIRKPKIEKFRRARINSSLESLKEILLRNTISIPQGSRPTKLEKADILEMTVRYVEMLHEKVYCLNGKSTGKLTEDRKIFGNINNNQSGKRQVPSDKEWLGDHFRSHLYNSTANKENLSSKIKDENRLNSVENHWRPW